jgi:hypothetical protein
VAGARALWSRASRARARAAACLLFATAGEVFLSLVWGLYDYRLGNIPLFVPPGHVLLFFLGTQIARTIPDAARWAIALLAAPLVAALRMERPRHAGPPALRAVLPLPGGVARAQALRDDVRAVARDGALRHVDRQLGVVARGPWLGLRSDNPPLAAGAFYCVLDLLVVSVTGRIGGDRGPQPPAARA